MVINNNSSCCVHDKRVLILSFKMLNDVGMDIPKVQKGSIYAARQRMKACNRKHAYPHIMKDVGRGGGLHVIIVAYLGVFPSLHNSTFYTYTCSLVFHCLKMIAHLRTRGSIQTLVFCICSDCVNNTFLGLRTYDSKNGHQLYSEFFLTGKNEQKLT